MSIIWTLLLIMRLSMVSIMTEISWVVEGTSVVFGCVSKKVWAIYANNRQTIPIKNDCTVHRKNVLPHYLQINKNNFENKTLRITNYFQSCVKNTELKIRTTEHSFLSKLGLAWGHVNKHDGI
jgi:hypothetical protein